MVKPDAGLDLLEWGDLFLVAFDSDVGGSKYIQCQRVSLWDSGASRFFEFSFSGYWLSREDDECESGDRSGCKGGCIGEVE